MFLTGDPAWLKYEGTNRTIAEAVCMLPDEEIDAFLTVVDDAIALAAEGKLVAGLDLLIKGLNQARSERLAGSPWAEEMIDRYRAARDNYCVSFGVPLG